MFTFINIRCSPGVYAPMYKNERTGEYVVSVFTVRTTTSGFIDHVFSTHSAANTFRENIRPIR